MANCMTVTSAILSNIPLRVVLAGAEENYCVANAIYGVEGTWYRHSQCGYVLYMDWVFD